MILCERYHAETGAIERLQPEQMAEALAQPETILWIDVEKPEEEELLWLAKTFGFHPLAMEDVRNQRQRAKIDRYESYYFFVLRAIHYHKKNHHVDSLQVDLFIGPNYLVTIHREKIPALDHARNRWEQANLPHEAVSYLFYLVADVIVDSYFPIIDEIGDLIDDLDAQIFTDPQTDTLQSIFALRKSLLAIRRILGPLRDAFNELIRMEEGSKFFPLEQTREYFSDVYDHVLRLTDFVDTYRDMLSGSLDAYQSSISNKLNQNMQRLTVAATVLATSTVITGFYGMNLQGLLINSGWPYGGHMVLAMLIVITLIEFWLFRRKGWI